MFDASTPASTITANVERLAAALTDGRKVTMHLIRDGNCGCVMGWAFDVLKISEWMGDREDQFCVKLGLDQEQFRCLTMPEGWGFHDTHSPAVAQAAASELRRLSAGGEPNPLWLKQAIEAEGK